MLHGVAGQRPGVDLAQSAQHLRLALGPVYDCTAFQLADAMRAVGAFADQLEHLRVDLVDALPEPVDLVVHDVQPSAGR